MTHISGKTRLAAVVGRPVAHSLSPLIHNAWIEAAGLDAAYVALSPTEEEFASLMDACRGGMIAGVNITLPFKEKALAAADQASDRARRAGAANLLLFGADGTTRADNTDGIGMLAALAAQAPAFEPKGATIALLGAGGAARGAAATLLDAGAAEVRLVNRTRERAERLAAALGGPVRVFDRSDISAALSGAAALINTTSLGLEGGEALDIDLASLPAGAVVMDMVYWPLRTPLLQTAAHAGHPTVDGLEMLVGQAAPSFEAFFGRPPPPLDVRALALAALESRMIIIGLTGSIGMGKSTTAGMFAAEGLPVYDADAEVHRLYAAGGAAVAAIEAAFPGVVRDGAVDRIALGNQVLHHPEALKRLNAIVHPLLNHSRTAFFADAEADGVDMVVLDVPLLFETGGEARVDAVVVASAPEALQRERVLARPGMDAAKLDAILAKQMHDAEKRAKAHFVVDTGEGLDHAREQVRAVIAALRAQLSEGR